MKIVTAKIPTDGLDLEFSKNSEWLAEGLEKNDELKSYINGKMSCNCRLEILKNDIFIKGKVTLELKPVCFRCGTDFEKEYSVNMDITCIPDTRKKTLRADDYMDGDVGSNYYSGGEIDLATIAREQVFLSLPMTFLCDANCKGLCSGCGRNLNKDICRCETIKNP